MCSSTSTRIARRKRSITKEARTVGVRGVVVQAAQRSAVPHLGDSMVAIRKKRNTRSTEAGAVVARAVAAVLPQVTLIRVASGFSCMNV